MWLCQYNCYSLGKGSMTIGLQKLISNQFMRETQRKSVPWRLMNIGFYIEIVILSSNWMRKRIVFCLVRKFTKTKQIIIKYLSISVTLSGSRMWCCSFSWAVQNDVILQNMLHFIFFQMVRHLPYFHINGFFHCLQK